MPADHVQAYHDLIQHGLQPVLCTAEKSPIWERWNSKNPSVDHVVHHDSLVGHIPCASSLVVFDVDGGTDEDIEAFCIRYPSLLRAPSAQPGRCHVYYLSDTRVRSGKFAGHGVSGDVRGVDGYVILWGDAVVRLRDALRNGDGPPAVPPLHLIIPSEPVSCDGSETEGTEDMRVRTLLLRAPAPTLTSLTSFANGHTGPRGAWIVRIGTAGSSTMPRD